MVASAVAPSEAVEPGHYHRVARPQQRQHFIQRRPLCGHARNLLLKDPVATVALQGVDLGIGVLFRSRDATVGRSRRTRKFGS